MLRKSGLVVKLFSWMPFPSRPLQILAHYLLAWRNLWPFMKAFRMFSFPSIAIFSFSFLPLTISLIYILNITLDFPFMWLCLELPNTSFLLLLSVDVSYEGLLSCFVGSLLFSPHSESLPIYSPPPHPSYLTSSRKWKPSQILTAFVSCYVRRRVFLES